MVDLLLQISLHLFFPSLKLLAENHSIIRANIWFADIVKSIKFSVQIIILVSSANNQNVITDSMYWDC